MVVHDLKSPLMSVGACLDMLGMDDEDPLSDGQQEILGRARQSCRTMADMVGSLLDVSRLETGEMPINHEPCDLGGLAQDAVDAIGFGPFRATPTCALPPTPVVANCDSGLVRRVIANLVSNALKFTPEEGSVTVRVESTGDMGRVAVVDTGYGIPPEHHEKIFEKFGQVEARRQGKMFSTGLGLTFCKLAVEAHGGAIGLESEVDQGSTFWFTVPLDAQRGGTAGPAAGSPHGVAPQKGEEHGT
jgi:signal transduction histidine kinase